jgi:hypothetical protein
MQFQKKNAYLSNCHPSGSDKYLVFSRLSNPTFSIPEPTPSFGQKFRIYTVEVFHTNNASDGDRAIYSLLVLCLVCTSDAGLPFSRSNAISKERCLSFKLPLPAAATST